MNILMMTNTYTPILGGLERSVKSFTEAYRRRGHRVIVVAPSFKGMPKREYDVVRVPAIQHFTHTDFSVRVPVPGLLRAALKRFRPDIVHAHHPFLMGDTALRLAAGHQAPLVFTHHTLFEQYTHYLPLKTHAVERFVMELATAYANLCDQVFSPSQSVADLLRERGVRTPIAIVPTGIKLGQFSRGDGQAFRAAMRIPEDAFVVGHLGRLAPEKNLEFLARSVARFLKNEPRARFVVIGDGPSVPTLTRFFTRAGLTDRVHFTGAVSGQGLADAYRAMDVFAFASKSETQGLVLIEAMAARTPVVAIEAPGVREVVEDGRNGRLLPGEDPRQFAAALASVKALSPEEARAMRSAALATAKEFSMTRCADRALALYREVSTRKRRARRIEHRWSRAARRIQIEWSVFKKTMKATGAAFNEPVASR
jgi:glycosyltransferase involved in cell wall biosynthesis